MPSNNILDIPIQNLKYFGESAVKKLEKLKIKTVRDLLYHFPYRYEDFSKFTPISQIKPNTQATIQGTILNVKNIRIFKKRMVITEALVGNENEAVKSVWFNQSYLLNQLKPGQLINLSGKAVLNKNRFYLSNPIYEIISYGNNQKNKKELLHTGRIIPIYPETAGLTSRWLRFGIKPVLKLANQIPDPLPQEIKKNYSLFSIGEAMDKIHFPGTLEEAAIARKRFAFEELFILQIFTALERLKLAQKKAPPVKFYEKAIKNFVDSLPYKLTDDQRKAAWQIIKDIQNPWPMNRLLQGDVGSGKTIVATIAAYLAALNGYQTAFMAPTEILSRQHFEKISPLLNKFKIKTGLITSAEAKIASGKIPKKEFIKKIENGDIQIIIGTHSLIQKNVKFKKLALAVIDEQHRFGVSQRAALANSQRQIADSHKPNAISQVPHLLSMSATPIPRTLGLTIWGDLDLSFIKELPRDRKNIVMEIITPEKRNWVYEFIKNEIKKGRQAFVVCPLIEESEKLQVKAAKKEYDRLKTEIFLNLNIGLLYGRQKSKEKERVMAEFLNKNLDVLVTTPVVEVGIDVPNATVMMIEGADRFGLASLYQFRGRVGRSEHQSYCFLLTEPQPNENKTLAQTNKRLKAVLNASSGFELAEKDLEIRGPGDFAGVRQSGLPDLAIASLTDIKLTLETREAAKKILAADLTLKKYPLLASRLAEFRNKIHFE